MIPWPFAAVPSVLAVLFLGLAIVQTRRLRDRPTRWETDHVRDATEKVDSSATEGKPYWGGHVPPPKGGSVVRFSSWEPRGEP